MKNLVIEVKDYKGPDHILNMNLSFQVFAGQLIEITGPNGAGKSTLLKELSKASTLPSRNLKGYFKNHLYQPQLVQEHLLLDWSLLEVIRLVCPQASKSEVLSLGLIDRASTLDQYWNLASGGEKQKTLLTQCLMSQSEVLFLDEPQNHLDHKSKDIFELGLKKKLEEQKTIVLVTHSPLISIQPDLIVNLGSN